jgi:ABC-2 type transport system permease protein
VLALVLGAVPGLIVFALVVNPPPPGVGGGFFTLATNNGVFAPVAALAVTAPFLLPLTAGLLSGDAIAGEAAAGTLRYLLVRPVRREAFVLGKYAAVVALLLAGVGLILLVGLAAGSLAFGFGAVPSLSGTTLTTAAALARLGLAALYVVAGVSALAAVGLFISSLTESGPGATIATVGVAIVGQILGVLESVAFLHPYLLNTHWLAFIELFRTPIATARLLEGLTVYAAYTATFLALALLVVRRKDVLT